MSLAEATEAGRQPAGSAAGGSPPRGAWIRSLFPEPAAAGPSARALLLGVLGFLALMGVSISRTGGPGALNSTWIEDAKRFLTGALGSQPAREVVFTPFNGYLHVGPRLSAEIATLFGVRWAAPVLTLIAVALITTAAAVAYTASGRFFQQWWLRALVAVPVVMVPVGHTQADNDIATVQFFAFYALFWALLWRPRTPVGKVVVVAVALYTTTSSILPVVLLPLLLLRLWAVRDWVTRAVAVAYLFGLGLQGYFMLTGDSSRAGVGRPRYNPLWLLKEYADSAVPRAVLGEKWLGGPGTDISGWPVPWTISGAAHLVLTLVAWALVATVVVLAVRRVTNPHWPLAVAAIVSGGLFFAAAVSNMGWTQPRYVIPVALLLYVALVALLRPVPAAAPAATDARPRLATRVPVFGLVVLLAVVCAVNLRGPNGRSTSQGWDETVRQATAACAAQPGKPWFDYRHTWWTVRIPCRRLR
ncbi:hypothetical protein AB0J74_24770 [Asanoa sp. NPDC049573]|uniref:hypothetical protein n=1 Tax=Asanoa sp. NPDC049573 TaxID=3155396 RepID=UPI00342AF303